MDWEHLRHFSMFARQGSFAAAARALGVEHATVARRVAALEADLQLKLVDRRGRQVVLTSAGEQLAAIARRIQTEADAAQRIAAASRSELVGEVTVSAPPALAAARLVGPLVSLQERHPGLTIRLVGESRSAALDKREADIAIRLSRPEQGDFTIVKLGEIRFQLYASAEYLEQVPRHRWRFVGYDAPMDRAPQEIALREIAAGRCIAFASNQAEIQLAAVAAGAGVGLLPDFMAARMPSLRRSAPDDAAYTRDIWLVVHSDMKNAISVRAVIECLKGAVMSPDHR